MVANFSPEFADCVARGEKYRTIRRKPHGKVGDRAQLYTGQRTKACRKLVQPDPVITGITPVTLTPTALYVKHVLVARACADTFARRDGFADYDAMMAWFSKRYGPGKFSGYLHVWSPVAAIQAQAMELESQ